jgi:RNA polymerase sigma factor (sigma-70 family)
MGIKGNYDVEKLINLVVTGDSDAFSALVEKYNPMLKKILDSYTTEEMSKEDVEDLGQEELIAFYRAIINFDAEQKNVEFGLYAKICVTNSMISYKRAAAKKSNESLIGDEEINSITDPDGEVSKFFAMRESERELGEQIEKTLSEYENKVWSYYVNGYSSKEIATKLSSNEKSIDNAGKKFKYVYDKYLNGTSTNVYFSIIPDKNYYLIGEDENYLSLDYEKLVTDITSKTDYMKYIDIFSELSIDSYYKTDSHWRQEKIVPVAEKLASNMGVTLSSDYDEIAIGKDFDGVYKGQYAGVNVGSDGITVLTNDVIYDAMAFDYQNEKAIPVYDESKCNGRDPYEAYLGGPLSLVTIENGNATTEKELIMFRDSFGSSLAPLFIEGYKKITLVDIRYMHPNMLEQFIEFNNQDVLFIYSTSVLNNSEMLK